VKKSDVGVVVFVYAICLFFYIFLQELPPEAQTYPLCLISGLFILNTLFLVLNLIKLKKTGLENDLHSVFEGFLKSQFFTVLAACVIYIFGVFYIGFYITSIAYLILIMSFLKVPLKNSVLTVFVLGLVIYFVFTMFLKVPLPVGIVFE
jgi:magnesium-transporting ATPase (P-type)